MAMNLGQISSGLQTSSQHAPVRVAFINEITLSKNIKDKIDTWIGEVAVEVVADKEKLTIGFFTKYKEIMQCFIEQLPVHAPIITNGNSSQFTLHYRDLPFVRKEYLLLDVLKFFQEFEPKSPERYVLEKQLSRVFAAQERLFTVQQSNDFFFIVVPSHNHALTNLLNSSQAVFYRLSQTPQEATFMIHKTRIPEAIQFIANSRVDAMIVSREFFEKMQRDSVELQSMLAKKEEPLQAQNGASLLELRSQHEELGRKYKELYAVCILLENQKNNLEIENNSLLLRAFASQGAHVSPTTRL